MNQYNFEVDRSQLDPEELEMFDEMNKAIDEGAFVLTPPSPERQAEIQAAARATNREIKKTFTTRLYQRDIDGLKAKAKEKGIPHNTLLASIIHQYLEGRLVEKT